MHTDEIKKLNEVKNLGTTSKVQCRIKIKNLIHIVF